MYWLEANDMAQDICDMCGYYEYDEETESYSCSVNLDEDEMYNFMSGSKKLSVFSERR